MSVKKYEIFLKTVDLGSLTKASQLLGYTQSAISHIISGLEDELGVKLLIRGRAGVRLTEEGKSLIGALRTICQDNQELLRQVASLHGLEMGTIRIGTFLSVSLHILPKLIYSFSTEYPHIEFELLQGNYEDIEQWLSEGRIDCGFLRLPTLESFETTLIVKEKFMAIFPESRVLDGDCFSTDSLQEEPYILRPDTLDGELSKVLKKAAYKPKIMYSYKDDYAVMAMVEQGLGMSILPELLMKGTTYHIQKKELDPPIYREICFAHKQVSSLSSAAQRFVAFTHQANAEGSLVPKEAGTS